MEQRPTPARNATEPVPAIAMAACVLWQRFLRHDPGDPGWADRDRFVLSSNRFRPLLDWLLLQAGVEPPEPDCAHGRHPLLEMEAGPPGQGFATAVGLAMGERLLAGRFGRTLVDHRTWVLACETDLAVGVSLEAAELAGRMELGKLTVLFEASGNGAPGEQQDGRTDAATRFAASGWAVRQVAASDPDAAAAAIARAQRNRRPTLIAFLQDAAAEPMPVDGAASWAASWAASTQRGASARRGWLRRLARHRLRDEFDRQMSGRPPPGWHRAMLQAQNKSAPPPMTLSAARLDLQALCDAAVPEAVTLYALAGLVLAPATETPTSAPPASGSRQDADAAPPSGAAIAAEATMPASAANAVSQEASPGVSQHGRAVAEETAPGASAPMFLSQVTSPGVLPGASSGASQERGRAVAMRNVAPDGRGPVDAAAPPPMAGPPATNLAAGLASGPAPGPAGGRHLFCGVQEHGMAAIGNGLALHGGVRPILAASVVSIDRMRPALRLAALMGRPVLYLLADQMDAGMGWPPVEQFASLRAMPRVALFRPADPVELSACWNLALHRLDGPSLIALSDRAASPRPAAEPSWRHEGCAQGGYVLAEAATRRQATLIATGPEVATALAARAILLRQGIETAVVSLPCWELFAARPASYHAQVLGCAPRIGIEAASGFGWERWLGRDGVFIGMDGFGPGRHTPVSNRGAGPRDAPAGITADCISTRVARLLGVSDAGNLNEG